MRHAYMCRRVCVNVCACRCTLIVIRCFLYQAVCDLKRGPCQVPRGCVCVCVCVCVSVLVCLCLSVWDSGGSLFILGSTDITLPVQQYSLSGTVFVCACMSEWGIYANTASSPMIKLSPCVFFFFFPFLSLSQSLLHHSHSSNPSSLLSLEMSHKIEICSFASSPALHVPRRQPRSVPHFPSIFFSNLFWPHNMVPFFFCFPPCFPSFWLLIS